MAKVVIALLCVGLVACKSTPVVQNWEGGKIMDVGEYVFKDKSLVVDIFNEHNFVRYIVSDFEGRELIKYDNNISIFSNWAFYLDENLNFWVFSSDIGHSVWLKSTVGGYVQKSILEKYEAPTSVCENCKEFF